MNKKEAILCAYIAKAAYTNRCDEDDFCITAKFENKDTDTQGLMGVAYDKAFVAAFRGSEETGLSDWITDVKFIQEPFPYGKGIGNAAKVHQGFLEAYQSVRDAVIKAVKDTPHKRVICAGHSLGAGLATLCALDIQYNVPGKMAYCYTYGSPKVGNSDFAAAYNQQVPRTYRFVNGSDLVPRVPPGSYEHVGELYHVGQESDSSFSLSDLVGDLLDTVEDHLPNTYITALRSSL